MIADRLEHWRQYFSGPVWTDVFEFLSGLGPDSPDADMIEIRGREIYARIMQYETKPISECVFEAHDAYIDVQMSLVNNEAIGWYPRSLLTVREPYKASEDYALFERVEPLLARVENVPGHFTVLFSQDAHMPGLVSGAAPEKVKKVVVKVLARLVQGC